MNAPQADGWTRRRFLGGLTLVGTAGLLGLHPRPSASAAVRRGVRLRGSHNR
jgi:hypothetical protein